MSKTVLAALVTLSLLFCAPGEPQCQPGRLSVSVNTGPGYLWLKEVQNWYDEVYHRQTSNYEKDVFGKNADLQINWHFAENHSLALGAGYTYIYVFHDAMIYGTYISTDVDISTVPVSLAYEFVQKRYESGAELYTGVGASVMFSSMKGREERDGIFQMNEERSGAGYGFFATCGVRKPVSRGAFLHLRLRARYADGMYFTDEPYDVIVDFTGFDIMCGLGWRFGG